MADLVATAATVAERLREEVGPDGVDPLVADLTQRVVGALRPLLAFLVSTGRWTGPLDNLADVRTRDRGGACAVGPGVVRCQAFHHQGSHEQVRHVGVVGGGGDAQEATAVAVPVYRLAP